MLKRLFDYKTVLFVFCLVFVFSSLALAMEYNEAPMLKVKVESGDLPAVEERLPENPLVLEPYSEIGKYGGTINKAFEGFDDAGGYEKFAFGDRLVRYSYDPAKGLKPDLAEDWEYNEEQSVFTFYLRKGVKWSDGHEMTAEDYVFYWKEILENPNVPEEIPEKVADKAATIKKIDDYTIQYNFYAPFPDWKTFFSKHPKIAPAHYLKQFHPDYNDDIEGWDEFRAHLGDVGLDSCYIDPDRPTVQPWKVVSRKIGQEMIAERNPYYWKVDPEGNQLPYTDRIRFKVVAEEELYPLLAINEEIDIQFRGMQFNDITLLKENEDKGNYKVVTPFTQNAGSALYINRYTPKQELRELFQNKQFRIALSHAINREELSKAFFFGTAEPMSYNFLPFNPFYKKEYFKKYTEYDPEKAKEIFAELGLKDRDDDGILEYESGKDLTIVLWVDSSYTDQRDAAEVIAKQFQNIGIDAKLHAVKSNVIDVQCARYQDEQGGPRHDILVFGGGGSYKSTKLERWFPAALDRKGDMEVNWWAAGEALWYLTDGEKGVKSSPELRRLQEILDELIITVDEDKRNKLFGEVAKLHAENAWMLGTTDAKVIGIVSNKLGNVKSDFTLDGDYRGVVLIHPEQFYFKD